MELTKRGKTRKLCFMLLHLVFLIGIVENIIMAAATPKVIEISGMEILQKLGHKPLEALIIIWVIGSTLAIVAFRKKIFPHDAEADRYMWDEPIQKTGTRRMLLISIPQLLVGIFVDLHYFFFSLGSAMAGLLYLVKLGAVIFMAVFMAGDRKERLALADRPDDSDLGRDACDADQFDDDRDDDQDDGEDESDGDNDGPDDSDDGSDD